MSREDAAKIYLDGLMGNNINEIGKFLESARILSDEDKAKIQMGLARCIVDEGIFKK